MYRDTNGKFISAEEYNELKDKFLATQIGDHDDR